MQEDFLYYLWKRQYFDKHDLVTSQGMPLNILQLGMRNEHAGPDFLDGKVVIAGVTWHGHIEMHLRASDWYAHQHQADIAYENVILHVVWEHDRDIQQPDGTVLPTLVLKDRVDSALHRQYQRLVQNPIPIPCASQLLHVNSLVRASMLDKTLFQRLTHKHNLVYRLLLRNNNDWEATAYQLLAYSFGFKVNSNPFLELAQRLPLKILAKHADNLAQLEALLLGHAGLLTPAKPVQDDYLLALQKEYAYLRHKHQLSDTPLTTTQWKFFRLRPANFPTIRIAQFAQLIHQYPNLFALLVNTPTKSLFEQLPIVQSRYWQQHYRWGKEAKAPISGLGKSSVNSILINTVVPLLVAYGKAKDEQDYTDRAVAILQHLPAEHNKITRYWDDVGIKVENAFDSQALIELFNNFCTPRKCLSCNIGTAILKGT
ncbi:MAG: DUF2851 family protein [Bacteroidota bacterium]